MIQKHWLFNKEVYLGGSKKKKKKKIGGGNTKLQRVAKKFILKSAKHDFVNSSGVEGMGD